MSTSCPQGQGIDAASLQILWILPALVDVCPWNQSLSLERENIKEQHSTSVWGHLSLETAYPSSVLSPACVCPWKSRRSPGPSIWLFTWACFIRYRNPQMFAFFSHLLHLGNLAVELMVSPLSQRPSLGSFLLVAVGVHSRPGKHCWHQKRNISIVLHVQNTQQQ